MASSNHSCLCFTFGAPNLDSRNRATHHFRKLVRNSCSPTVGRGYILYCHFVFERKGPVLLPISLKKRLCRTDTHRLCRTNGSKSNIQKGRWKWLFLKKTTEDLEVLKWWEKLTSTHHIKKIHIILYIYTYKYYNADTSVLLMCWHLFSRNLQPGKLQTILKPKS